MYVVVALDDKNGMCFNGRRLSMDSLLREHFLSFFGNSPIYMNAYSASQFEGVPFMSRENFLSCAGNGDVCFVENNYLSAHLGKIERIYVYRWNRLYPSDMNIDVVLDKYEKEVLCEFVGSSHRKITLEVYYVTAY